MLLECAGDLEALERLHTGLELLWEETPSIPLDARIRMETALAEIIGNVVQHGGDRSRPASLRVTVSVDALAVTAEVADDGPPASVEAPSELPDELQESGRGLFIAQELTDELRYERRDAGNAWFLVVGY